MVRPTGTLAAFLAMAFVATGLAGLFATWAAPLPLQRQAAREAALDAAMTAAGAADPAAALARLAPALGESAVALTPGPGLEARILAERQAMRARFATENEVTLKRLRWLIATVTATAAAFGLVLLHLAARARR
jgi:hypothetical protein